MKLSYIMTEEVVTVDMDDSLMKVAEIFDEVKFHHLLVTERGELRGIISDRDLLKASSPFVDAISERKRDAAILKKRARQIMTGKPITVTTQASSEEAACLMLNESVSCLPVISADGAIDGIITWKDLLGAYVQKEFGGPVAESPTRCKQLTEGIAAGCPQDALRSQAEDIKSGGDTGTQRGLFATAWLGKNRPAAVQLYGNLDPERIPTLLRG